MTDKETFVSNIARKHRTKNSKKVESVLKKKEIRVYMAGPISFVEEMQSYRAAMSAELRKLSSKFTILDPWEREKVGADGINFADISEAEEKREISEEIITRDLKDIISCDLLIAYMFRIGSGTCLSMDTEILTEEGWKFFDNLKIGEKVLALNLKSDKLEFTPVLKKIETKQIPILFKNRTLNMKVTGNHGILLQRQRSSINSYFPLETQLASDVLSNSKTWIKIPVSRKLGSRTGSSFSHIQLKLLAWILTEGSREINGNYSRITISQSPKHAKRCERIREILHSLEIPFSEYLGHSVSFVRSRKIEGTCIRFRFNAKFLPREFLDNWKRIPRSILNRTRREECRLLLAEIMLGDGCDSSQTIAEKRWDLISDYQELALLCGRRSSISKFRNGYQLYLAKRAYTFLRKDQGKYLEKEERMWCCKTPLHTLIVRRKGHPFITHNSMEVFFCNRVLRKPVIIIYTNPSENKKVPLWLYGNSNLIFKSKRGMINWIRRTLEEIEDE